MITIFTIPKPFYGHTLIIQHNAIRSWMHLIPRPEIILCGDDPGVADFAVEWGLIHIPQIEKNELGTPLLNSAFREVQNIASNRTLTYINADVIFLDDLIKAIQKIKFKKFLLCGQRINVDIVEPIDYVDPAWKTRLRELINRTGKWSSIDWIDYFIFRKHTFTNLPAFAVGRPRWDNWMIYYARTHQIPVVDLSKVVTAIHQNHDYSHVKLREGSKWEGPEADHNLELAGGSDHLFDMLDAPYQLTSSGVKFRDDDLSFNRLIDRQRFLITDSGFSTCVKRRLFWFCFNRLRFLPGNYWKRAVSRFTY